MILTEGRSLSYHEAEWEGKEKLLSDSCWTLVMMALAILTARYAVAATSLFGRSRKREDVKRAIARFARPDAARHKRRKVATATVARGCWDRATERCAENPCAAASEVERTRKTAVGGGRAGADVEDSSWAGDGVLRRPDAG
jgi:hypothetical protein